MLVLWLIEIGCGFATGSPTTIAIGLGGLVLDVGSFGLGRVASNTARAVRLGKKGKSLVKAARAAKRAKKIGKTFDNINNARSVINNARKFNWGLCWSIIQYSVIY